MVLRTMVNLGIHFSGDCKMPIGKLRGWLYFIAKILGDINAVQRGRIGRRIARRLAGKVTGRWLGRLFR